MGDDESNPFREKDSINTYLIDTYQVDDSFAHCHGHLWCVCNTPLHRYPKNGSFRVGGFNGESNFWSVRVGAYCIRPSTYRAGDSIDERESNFWSVRVGAYCIHPRTYRAGDSIDKRESNFLPVRVGRNSICPRTYPADDSMNRRELIFWSVCVGAYCIRPRMYRAGDSMGDVESYPFWEKDSTNTYLTDTYRANESFAHCHGYLWGVCHTPLHRYTKNGSLWVGGFNGESNFWRV